MIIAVDFDGILCENKFPEIGPPNYEIISAVRQLIDCGQEVVLWTSRVDAELEAAVKWCEDYGLRFCAVNENAPSNIQKYITKYPHGTRKVYADIYIDDHNIGFAGLGHSTLKEALLMNIQSLLRRVKNEQR